MSDTSEVGALIAKHVRDIPDFPKPGILFKDITPLLADGPAFATAVEAMRIGRFDVVAGIEARGFLIGAAIAYAAGVGIVPIRKAGKLPGETLQARYELEYGTATIEMHADAIGPGQRVLLVDDVLATGGTMAATLTLLGQVDAQVSGVAVILELSALGGRARLAGLGYEPHALLSV